jgi:hypothetical protein
MRLWRHASFLEKGQINLRYRDPAYGEAIPLAWPGHISSSLVKTFAGTANDPDDSGFSVSQA